MPVEAMTERVVEALLSGQQDLRPMVRDLVESWPDVPPLEIAFVLSLSAGTVEALLAGPQIERAAQHCWRMAGLISVDLRMMQAAGLAADRAADLLAYWQAHDRFFLD